MNYIIRVQFDSPLLSCLWELESSTTGNQYANWIGIFFVLDFFLQLFIESKTYASANRVGVSETSIFSTENVFVVFLSPSIQNKHTCMKPVLNLKLYQHCLLLCVGKQQSNIDICVAISWTCRCLFLCITFCVCLGSHQMWMENQRMLASELINHAKWTKF